MKPASEVNSNGKTYYFSFGMTALSRFCEAEGLSLNDLGQLSEGMTPLRAMRLIHAGLRDGYRREGVKFTIDIDDVGDIIDADPEFMTRCLVLVSESMPQGEPTEGNVAAATKRKTSR